MHAVETTQVPGHRLRPGLPEGVGGHQVAEWPGEPGDVARNPEPHVDFTHGVVDALRFGTHDVGAGLVFDLIVGVHDAVEVGCERNTLAPHARTL